MRQLNGEGFGTTPIFKLQPDSSLIIVTRHFYNNNGPGPCGACDYEDYDFYSIKKDSGSSVFGFSFNTGNSTAYYSFRNQKGEEQTGKFYLDSPSEEYINYSCAMWWKNNSTCIIKINNDTNYRNYTMHFISSKGTTYAAIKIGPMMAKKDFNS